MDGTDQAGDGRMNTYREALLLIERLHRRFLDVLKAEIDRSGRADVNSVQALILYNIGDDEITVGDLTNRGYYLGSNVSYNIKQLSKNGYIEQERSPHDRRAIRVRLSVKGKTLRQDLTAFFKRHVEALLSGGDVTLENLEQLNTKLRRIERFWSDQIQYRG